MDASATLKVIEKIAATSSKNDKEVLVGKFIDDEFFLKTLTAALDPFVTYGIKKLPKIAEYGEKEFKIDSIEWAVLDSLASRALTGGEAEDALIETLMMLNEASATLFTRILLKDLRAGFSRNTVNRVRPGTIATFDCMLAQKYAEKRLKGKTHAIEPKLDGVRVLAFVSSRSVGFYSRSGKAYLGFDHLIEPLLKIGGAGANVVIDGEVMSGEFNKTVGDVRRKDTQATDAVFYVFDIIPAELFKGDKGNETTKDYSERRVVLERCVKMADSDVIKILPRYLVTTDDEVQSYYAKFRERGFEGAIVKPVDATYQRKRSYGWMKLKGSVSFDLRITGAFEGEGKYVGSLGGLIVDHAGVSVRVGGGFSDKQRADFWKEWLIDSAVHPELGDTLYELDPDACNLVGRLVEVTAHEETPDGSLRHPVFTRFRDDKDMKAA